jgi:hypothetical protein
MDVHTPRHQFRRVLCALCADTCILLLLICHMYHELSWMYIHHVINSVPGACISMMRSSWVSTNNSSIPYQMASYHPPNHPTDATDAPRLHQPTHLRYIYILRLLLLMCSLLTLLAYINLLTYDIYIYYGSSY